MLTSLESCVVCVALCLLPHKVEAVGASTEWRFVPPELVRECANGIETVSRRFFCHDMTECILDALPERTKASMAAGGALIGLLPTATVLLAGQIEDVLTIARRDPLFGFIMAWSTGGAKGCVRQGRIAEIDAGSWWTEQELLHRADAVVLPALISSPPPARVNEETSKAKLRFVRQELLQLQRRYDRYTQMSRFRRGWLETLAYTLRIISAVATGLVFWLSFVRQETACNVWWDEGGLWIPFLLNIVPPLFDYFGTPLLEYREFWTLENDIPIVWVSGKSPSSARGAETRARQAYRRISYWQNMLPSTLVPRNQSIYVLVWRSEGLVSETYRSIVLFWRAGVYLWSTATLISIIMIPFQQSTQWFMATIGLLMFNRVILLVLDLCPGSTNLITEATVR